MAKIWKYRTGLEKIPPSSLNILSEGCGISTEFARLLWIRGIRSVKDGCLYLDSGLQHLEDPNKWPGMMQAAQTLAEGLKAGGKLAVWGDYDVDGITGTAVALEVLAYHGYDALWHIPDRRTEGYGMNVLGIKDLHDQGASMLLTIDCGISDQNAIKCARDLGMTVVVTDHHLPPQALPPANVICNPRVGGGPCLHLAGVGVAFFVLAALNNLLAVDTGKKMDMRRLLDLVALGTLADLVELQGQNRILVKNGLKVLADSVRPGIAELKVSSGYSPSAVLGGGQVVFSLAPRINAAGRMASAQCALKLLRTDNYEEARAFALKLNEYNTQRRREEDAICKVAMEEADRHASDPAFIIAGEDWNQGVIGIVASRILERYNKPVFVLCRDGENYKGSGRSIDGFDLHAGLASCSDDLLSFGGHSMAAGIRISPAKLDDFRAHFFDVVRAAIGSEAKLQEQCIDYDLDFRFASDFTFLKELELMQPFGVGNPEPVFASPLLFVRKIRFFGISRSHALLELTDEKSKITLKAKAWRQAELFPCSMEGRRIRIAYSPFIDMYNGVASVEVKIRDWRLEEDDPQAV